MYLCTTCINIFNLNGSLDNSNYCPTEKKKNWTRYKASLLRNKKCKQAVNIYRIKI